MSWNPEAQVFFDFIASSNRGICSANRVPEKDTQG